MREFWILETGADGADSSVLGKFDNSDAAHAAFYEEAQRMGVPNGAVRTVEPPVGTVEPPADLGGLFARTNNGRWLELEGTAFEKVSSLY